MGSNKKFLVSEMTKENKDKVKLKAHRLGVTIDELIINSINSYEPIKACPLCSEKNECCTLLKHSFMVGEKEIHVEIIDMPMVYCEKCVVEKEQPIAYDLKLLESVNDYVKKIALNNFLKTKEQSFSVSYQLLETIL